MREKYGSNKITVSSLDELHDKTIVVPDRTLVVIDEADAAFIDLKFDIHENDSNGFLLGLTATGCSTMENYELLIIHKKLKMLALSSGI